MEKTEDLIAVDYWASMAFDRNMTDELLRKRFNEFSLKADQMLLNDWKNIRDDRMQHICNILETVIKEKLK
ncbi:MAG: hypothetical protein K6G87_17670 [Butyrivibrio sp.]|uniref:hypothetical protein n=1 Tax=Butyrivibrio sp. TaxID=28121 RepID=UPI0025E0AB06|nr:hypothetical protein [Butyrivibrio sp.]MCR5773055.1 hypothetical protein [Butyrivibrio sp.]